MDFTDLLIILALIIIFGAIAVVRTKGAKKRFEKRLKAASDLEASGDKKGAIDLYKAAALGWPGRTSAKCLQDAYSRSGITVDTSNLVEIADTIRDIYKSRVSDREKNRLLAESVEKFKQAVSALPEV